MQPFPSLAEFQLSQQLHHESVESPNYAASIAANRVHNAQIMIYTGLLLLSANDEEEATQLANDECLKRYPEMMGFFNQTVAIAQL